MNSLASNITLKKFDENDDWENIRIDLLLFYFSKLYHVGLKLKIFGGLLGRAKQKDQLMTKRDPWVETSPSAWYGLGAELKQ